MKKSIVCPKCNKVLYYEINDKMMSKTVGLIPITIIHGYPDAHALVVYVDSNGANRGYEIIENLVDLRTSYNSKEVIRIIGDDKIAKIIAGIIGGYNLYINGDPESIKLLHLFLTKILKNQFFSIVDNEKLADVKINLMSKKNPKLPGEKYIMSLINEGMNLSESGYINMLSVKISRLKTKIRRVIELLEKRSWSKSELMSELEINDKELELIRQFIKSKRPDLYGKIINSIFDVF